jgi:chaperonin GroEL (HSP60 family)
LLGFAIALLQVTFINGVLGSFEHHLPFEQTNQSPPRVQAEELVPAVEGALRTLATLARQPGVLPGGGCGEALLAGHVRARAAAAAAAAGTTAYLQAGALEAVACALEAVAACLAAPACGGGDDRGAVADAVASLSLHLEGQLRAATASGQGREEGEGAEGLPGAASPSGLGGGGGGSGGSARMEYVGWDADAGLFGPVASGMLPPGWGLGQRRTCCLPVGGDARVLDAAAVKLGAVLCALEAAVTLLRIDGAVAACT